MKVLPTQQLTDLLAYAEHEEVMIKREDGAVFLLSSQRRKSSPFDIDGIDVNVSTEEIVEVVRESRQR
jgi:hypothetical protein